MMTTIALMVLLITSFAARSPYVDPLAIAVLIVTCMCLAILVVLGVGFVFLIVAIGFAISSLWAALVALKTTTVKNLTRSRSDER